MRISECLSKAKDRLRTPDRWTVKPLAVDQYGNRAEFLGDAYALEAVQACYVSGLTDTANAAIDLLNAEAPGGGPGAVWRWENSPEATHDGLLAMFDRAIAKARELFREFA